MEYAQRLSAAQLTAWQSLAYGMFIHFGMSTFTGEELSLGNSPSEAYAPDKLDVEQWVSTAHKAGMKYAVLTAKHVSGHCLWPSEHTNYHVGTSGNQTDVVEHFIKYCRQYGLMPGLYYCSWDNHHLFGSETPNSGASNWQDCYVTDEYMAFQTRQIVELITCYPGIGEIWIDIPKILPRGYRHKLYDQIAALSPECIIVMNNGIGDGSNLSISNTWPTDVVTIERFLPSSHRGYPLTREIEGRTYLIPGEVCDPIGNDWFFKPEDQPRSDAELLGMALVANARKANFLLDVPPDQHGLIPDRYIQALNRLKKNMERI